MNKIPADEAFAYHRATGCPIAQARLALDQMQPILRARVLEAARTQIAKGDRLHDPLEDDPALGADHRAGGGGSEEVVISRGPLRRGICHALWREQARP
jgi:hypothetical protein